MELWAIWLVIGIILFVIEMLTLTFYLLWVGIGAIAAALIALVVPDLFFVQVLAGCIVALVLTFFTKPLTRFMRKSDGFTDIIDELVGKQGIVIEGIDVGKNGIVKIGNETWSASSDQPLHKDEIVIIVHRGTTVLEVQKWEGVS
ncbi:NfeD family protein [Paenibacillus sp. FA6]|uniref:NfeD family protein n=1 Tax=Paenibacillus sp. FA6 TaxID=3413029 RepID=UPI003F65BCD1